MKARMAASSTHAVHVQNVLWASLNSPEPTLPAARLACRFDRNANHKNPGM
jgi:hypothetical protein